MPVTREGTETDVTGHRQVRELGLDPPDGLHHGVVLGLSGPPVLLLLDLLRDTEQQDGPQSVGYDRLQICEEGTNSPPGDAWKTGHVLSEVILSYLSVTNFISSSPYLASSDSSVINRGSITL